MSRLLVGQSNERLRRQMEYEFRLKFSHCSSQELRIPNIANVMI
jgi:hypothetical protein